ncbi:hypothetical protein M0R45_013563 [Rubus argutus]|uniref:Uncharacterized protein n=1 Tax=Rubus argutus TaxID=59490 RepID=A0AAW1XM82_RUBAR
MVGDFYHHAGICRLFAMVTLLLGGALACYGLLLCLRMRTVRSERASSEMWKVAGLALFPFYVLPQVLLWLY